MSRPAGELTVRVEQAPEAALASCLGAFEDFCVVTQSVRHGIPVAVSVNGRSTSSAGGGTEAIDEASG